MATEEKMVQRLTLHLVGANIDRRVTTEPGFDAMQNGVGSSRWCFYTNTLASHHGLLVEVSPPKRGWSIVADASSRTFL